VKQNDVGLHGGVEAETSIVPTGSIIAEQIIGKMVDPIPAVALMVYLRRCGECRRRITTRAANELNGSTSQGKAVE